MDPYGSLLERRHFEGARRPENPLATPRRKHPRWRRLPPRPTPGGPTLRRNHSHPVGRTAWERCYGLRRPRVRRLAYCRRLPDDRAPHGAVRASPWRNSEGRESAGSTTDPIASAWRWRHLEATDAPGTTWWPSPTGGLSTAAASCADAALNRTPDGVRAPGAGFGCGGRSDASAIPSCAWITVRLGSPLAMTCYTQSYSADYRILN